VRAQDAEEQWSPLSNLELAEVRPQTSVDDGEDNIPYAFALYNNYPNPFNAGTNISFSLPEQGYIKLDVINILGEKITTLAEGNYPAGRHSVVWDGQDHSGESVSSGFYFYRLSSGDKSVAKRMLMLK
jgi:hypothetical protein